MSPFLTKIQPGTWVLSQETMLPTSLLSLTRFALSKLRCHGTSGYSMEVSSLVVSQRVWIILSHRKTHRDRVIRTRVLMVQNVRMTVLTLLAHVLMDTTETDVRIVSLENDELYFI